MYKIIVKIVLFIYYAPVLLLYYSLPTETKKKIEADYIQAKEREFISAFRGNAGFRNLFYARAGKSVLAKICKCIAHPYSQIEIYLNEDIGKGLVVYHAQGCTINAKSIGNYCYIYQGVTIGKGKMTKIGNRPIVGNNVRICTNAVVIGGVNIGDHAVIGANSLVIDDVPPYAVVGGVPAKVLYKQ